MSQHTQLLAESETKALKKSGVHVYLPQQQQSSTRKKPVLVIIIAWFGATQRLVAKYASVYADSIGLPAITFIPPGYQYFTAKSLAASFLKPFKQLKLHEKFDFYIHSMSNNGGLFFSSLVSLCEQDASYKSAFLDHIIGFCADSFPGVRSHDTRAADVLSGKDFTAVGGAKPKLGLFALILVHILWVFWFILGSVQSLTDSFLSYKEVYQKKGLLKFPFLVLYAENDFLVPAEQVVPFWNEAEKNSGLDVMYEKFSGKEYNHIKILQVNPEGYKQALARFLTRLQAI